MLNQNQVRRLEAIDRWLREIRDSEEFKTIDYHPDLMIGDAIQAVGELLNEQSNQQLIDLPHEILNQLCNN